MSDVTVEQIIRIDLEDFGPIELTEAQARGLRDALNHVFGTPAAPTPTVPLVPQRDDSGRHPSTDPWPFDPMRPWIWCDTGKPALSGFGDGGSAI